MNEFRDRITFISDVVESCQTEEQVIVCRDWLDRVCEDYEIFDLIEKKVWRQLWLIRTGSSGPLQ